MPRSMTRTELYNVCLFLTVVGSGLLTGLQIKLIAIAHAPVPSDAQGLPEIMMWKMITPIIILAIMTYVFNRWQLSDKPVLATFTATAAIPCVISLANNVLIVFFAGLPDEFKAYFLQYMM